MPCTASLQFFHGLGDAANFAHLLSLWTKRGHEIEVECAPDLACLFQAAGARIVAKASQKHPFDHPPGLPSITTALYNPDALQTDYLENVNKIAWNLENPLLPAIGTRRELWPELCATRLHLPVYQANMDAQQKIDAFLTDLPRPLILLTLQGTTAPEVKKLTHPEQERLIHKLLDEMPGTCISLDWHDRVAKIDHPRFRCLSPAMPELLSLMNRAHLFISVDTGCLHLARFTKLPVLGLWPNHYAGHFVIPRPQTLNLIAESWREYDLDFRIPFQTVPSSMDGEEIACWALRLLHGIRWGLPIAQDVQLRYFLSLTDSGNDNEAWDRHRTFGAVLDWLTTLPDPTIVETGTIRKAEDWDGAGYSTYLFGAFLHRLGKGRLISVDVATEHCDFAREQTAGMPVTVIEADSHSWLAAYKGPPIDLFYSDSLDAWHEGSQQSCLKECQLVLPHLAPHGKILIDDTPFQDGQWQHKGGLAVPWLLEHGFEVEMQGWQTLLKRTHKQTPVQFWTPDKPRLLILKNHLSPGDVCCMTAAVYCLHRANPGQFQTAIDSIAPAVWENNPDVVDLAWARQERGEVVQMHYPLVHQSNQRPVHVLQGYCDFLADNLRVKVPLVVNHPLLYLSEAEKQEPCFLPGKFHLICSGTKADFTCKGWGQSRYQEVVDRLRGKVQFVQVGAVEHQHPVLNGVINQVGKTDLRRLILLAYHAQGVLCGVTLLQHIAAAFSKPAVIIGGGREPKFWTTYPTQILLSSVGLLSCCRNGGCWKSRVVPLGDGSEQDHSLCEKPVGDPPIPECMAIITPEQVARAILQYQA